jgi:hypothetical protein
VRPEEDTSQAAKKVQVEIWRGMTPEQKLRLMRDMTLAIQRLAFSELRQRYPDSPDDELWLRLAARRLSPETMRNVYGLEIDPS